MVKRILALFISLFILATFAGCNDTDVEPLSEEEKAELLSIQNDEKEIENRVKEMLAWVGLEKSMDKYPSLHKK